MMNQLIAMNAELTMSSLDFLSNVINPARVAAGESELRNSEMIRKIESECDDLGGLQIFSNPLGTDQKYYELTIDQMTLVGMRESKAVRRNVLAKLKEMEIPKVPQTYAAALLEAGRLAAELEQKHELVLSKGEPQTLTQLVGRAAVRGANSWLLEHGYVTTSVVDGWRVWFLTDKGKEFGVQTKERNLRWAVELLDILPPQNELLERY